MVVDDVSEEGSMPESILGLGDFGKGPELFSISVRLKQSLRLSLRTNWMIPLIRLSTLMCTRSRKLVMKQSRAHQLINPKLVRV